MPLPLSRRSFLALTGAALAVPPISSAANDDDDDEVPALLDHILLGCNDLNRGIVHYQQLRSMTDPRLIGWAVHPPDIAAVAKQLRENKIAFTGPDDGSRKRPDGRVLTWKTVNLADDGHGLLPFFIEWSADTVHPSKDAPAQCSLAYFEIMSDEPDELSATFKRIGLDLPVERSDKARLRTLISGPKGDLGLSTA
jgi:hypothetical protein